ncbi:hypothetical protein FDO65_18070 [Nakamurella flava]|uniref:Uncharacterized protein n=1 Tax=Nakamurella flava TaxID=2576308 RepID=A0A4U6QA18_9ACTN|nr:hypothetical protein [Nakamurella flava]TKV56760.1 hypothetical protein FDO65_18070 [Nakamurella flava]
MHRPLRSAVLAAVLALIGTMITAPTATARDATPVVDEVGLPAALMARLNQARAAVGSPPLQAAGSAFDYARYTVNGEWACGGGTNPYGIKMAPTFGVSNNPWAELMSSEPAATATVDSILTELTKDNTALLQPQFTFVGIVSITGGEQCPDQVRTAAIVTGGVLAMGRVVTLMSKANGLFVTAENGGRLPLIAARDAVGGSWEQFDMVSLSATDVSLRSLANGRYVTGEAAGTRPLIANRSGVGGWETFTVVPVDATSVALFSHSDDRWVSADDAGQSPLIADRVRVGTWEQFELRDGRGQSQALSSVLPAS